MRPIRHRRTATRVREQRDPEQPRTSPGPRWTRRSAVHGPATTSRPTDRVGSRRRIGPLAPPNPRSRPRATRQALPAGRATCRGAPRPPSFHKHVYNTKSEVVDHHVRNAHTGGRDTPRSPRSLPRPGAVAPFVFYVNKQNLFTSTQKHPAAGQVPQASAIRRFLLQPYTCNSRDIPPWCSPGAPGLPDKI